MILSSCRKHLNQMIKDCHGSANPLALFKSFLCHLSLANMPQNIMFIVLFLLLEHKLQGQGFGSVLFVVVPLGLGM